MEQALSALRDCPLFSGLPEALLQQLLETGRKVRLAPGETVFAQGGSERMLGVMLSGEAAVYRRSGDSAILMSVLGCADPFGAATLFCDAPAATEIRARKNCSALLFSEEQVRRMLRESEDLALRYIRYLTSRIHFLTDRIGNIACTGAGDRLYGFLVQNAVSGLYRLPAGMQGLAEAVGVSRASLYRVLDALEAEGRVKREGQSLRILK